jgi:para-aminobenzoate synthetase component 1
MTTLHARTREPVWQEIPYVEPLTLARKLQQRKDLVFLDSARRHETLGRYAFIMCDPVDCTFSEFGLAAARQILDGFRLDHIADLPPFQGGLTGYLAYELGQSLEPELRRKTPAPDILPLALKAYDVVISFDQLRQRAFIVSSGFPEAQEAGRKRRARQRLTETLAMIENSPPRPEDRHFPPLSFVSNFTRQAFEAAIARTVEYVLAGDIFQANIAQRFSATVPHGYETFAFYERLRRTNPSTFGAYLHFDDLVICSSSPERLMRLNGRHAEARPIKGTRQRVADPEADLALQQELLTSRKDRAENVMIVDLLRNDLSRVCKPGTVDVPVLCGLETYESVHHLVSVVTGELSENAAAVDLLAACFPGGSVTGAPKIRAMEIIGEIEKVPRNIYCGSIGYLSFSGTMDFNIAIRTAMFHQRTATFCGGGGITARSEPSAEYEETLHKVTRIKEAFGTP